MVCTMHVKKIKNKNRCLMYTFPKLTVSIMKALSLNAIPHSVSTFICHLAIKTILHCSGVRH